MIIAHFVTWYNTLFFPLLAIHHLLVQYILSIHPPKGTCGISTIIVVDIFGDLSFDNVKARRCKLELEFPSWFKTRSHGTASLTDVAHLLQKLYLMLWRQIQDFVLNDQPDQIIWKWNLSGIYTAKSCYMASFQGFNLPILEANLENMGASTCKFFHCIANKE